MKFSPKFTITPKIVHAIASIEASRQSITDLPVNAHVLSSLRESARLSSTHYSTAIEGNNLTASEVKSVVKDGSHFPHREKDEKEVINYYRALEYIDEIVKNDLLLSEENIQILHGISFLGVKKPSPYRDGQNVIRNGILVVYIPPKASEVPILMKSLVEWIVSSIKEGLPLPIVAGLAHYQFATIHPYYDGNGRTARLLVTLILQKYGYGLKGIYSLEEYYAQNLQAYYDALTVGDDEDYYDGKREEADLTNFLEYFTDGMSQAFLKVKKQAQQSQIKGSVDQSPLLRDLTPQQKQILKLFIASKEISSKHIAEHFGFSMRQARTLCQKWIAQGFIEVGNPSQKMRTYKLCPKYESLILDSFIKTHD